MRALEKIGVYSAEETDIPDNCRAVIRSHGAGKEVFDRLNARNIQIVDATCPHVKRIHEMVYEAAQKDIPSIIIGAVEHPEVQGILGWSMGKGITIATESEAYALPEMESANVSSPRS